MAVPAAAAAAAAPAAAEENATLSTAPVGVSADLMAAAFGAGGIAGFHGIAGLGLGGAGAGVGAGAGAVGGGAFAGMGGMLGGLLGNSQLPADAAAATGSLTADTAGIAHLIQKLCATELGRFPTPLHADEAMLMQWHVDDASSPPVSVAERCGVLSRVGTKRVLHAAIEQAWSGAEAAASAGPGASGKGAAESAAASASAGAEAAVTLAWCQALPKVELHAHLNGSLDAPALKALLAHPANASDVPDAELMVSERERCEHASIILMRRWCRGPTLIACGVYLVFWHIWYFCQAIS